MNRAILTGVLLLTGALSAQTVNPNQIRPSGHNGDALQTLAGKTVWSPLPGSLGWSCQPGVGDGLHALPAGTYLTTTCKNETGAAIALTSIRCVDDTGTSTCNVTNSAGTALLTGAITATPTYATGTQSATTALAAGDYLLVTYVADGTTKQIGIDVTAAGSGGGGGGGTGGSTVAVNSSATIPAANFNNTIPLPGSGYLNASWQYAGANISAEVPYATNTTIGVLRPDGITCTATAGVLTCPGSGGGGSPGGSSGNLQYNSSGAFGGDTHTNLDGSGNVTAHSYATNGSTAGIISFNQGSAATPGGAGYLDITVPTSVTAYTLTLPGTAPSGSNTYLSCPSSLCAWTSVSSAFSAITSGTNTSAAMRVGAGASLGTTSTGTIQATIVGSAEVVTFSATPTFSTATHASRIVLTGNITSFTLAAGADGQTKTLCFAQDATGGRTVTPPANVHGFFTPGTTASKWSCQDFGYDNTDSIWLAKSAGVINE